MDLPADVLGMAAIIKTAAAPWLHPLRRDFALKNGGLASLNGR
jgi:hypothetical protein